MTSGVTTAGLGILLHTLGLTDPMTKEPYRNYFVAGPGHDDLPTIKMLCWAGFMKEHTSSGGLPFCDKDDRLFLVTDIGISVAQKHRPKISRGQRRYRRFLSVADAWPDLTFREFLISPDFAQYRSEG